MSAIDLDPNLVLVGTDVVPFPSIVALEQSGAYVQIIVVLPPLTGNTLLTQLRVYRAPSTLGRWTLIDNISPSPISVYNNLYDIDPPLGHQTYYAATVVNALGFESAQSPPLSISAQST
jgi:hypothetical protein